MATGVLFDKTGTLTQGHPTVVEVVLADDRLSVDDVVRLSASLDQVSPRTPSAIVTYARKRDVELVLPTDVHEVTGYGLPGVRRWSSRSARQGTLDRRGESAPSWVRQVRRRAAFDGSLTVFIAVDGAPAGAFMLEDPIRALMRPDDSPPEERGYRAHGARNG